MAPCGCGTYRHSRMPIRRFAPTWDHRRGKYGTTTPPANHSRRSAAECPDTPAPTAVQARVPSRSWYQLLTVAGDAETVITSVLTGRTMGLAGRPALGIRGVVTGEGAYRRRCAGGTEIPRLRSLAQNGQFGVRYGRPSTTRMAYRTPIIYGFRCPSAVLVLFADLPFMYLFELVADDLCGPVAYSRATSAVARICPGGLRRVAWPGAAGCRCHCLRGRSDRAGRLRVPV